MGRFNKTGKRGVPALNTASLPDLIFTLLFFFMIVTNMRDSEPKVDITLPEATQLEKLERKTPVTFIYVGKPSETFRDELGDETRIQLNDAYADLADIPGYMTAEREAMSDENRQQAVVSLKVDQDTPMGIVADIKEALRQADALNVHYVAQKRK